MNEGLSSLVVCFVMPLKLLFLVWSVSAYIRELHCAYIHCSIDIVH
jgi:hypothetical protein